MKKVLLTLMIPALFLTFFIGGWYGIDHRAPNHHIEVYTCKDIYLIDHLTVTSDRGIYRTFNNKVEVRDYISSLTARDVQKCAGTFN